MIKKSIQLKLFGFLFLALFCTHCQQSKLNGIEPVQPKSYPPEVSAVTHNKTTLKITGTNLDSTSSVKLSGADGSSPTLSIASKSTTDVVVAPSANFTFKLNTLYSLLVKNAYGETSVSFTVDLTNVAAGSFTVGIQNLVVASNGQVGIGTNSPIAGAALDITSSGTGAFALLIPREIQANLPNSGTKGMVRYNSTTSRFEVYESSSWVHITPDTKCSSQYITYTYVVGASVFECIALMPTTIAGLSDVISISNEDTNTSAFSSGCTAASSSHYGTLVTLGSSPTSCKDRCRIKANCNSTGAWVFPRVEFP